MPGGEEEPRGPVRDPRCKNPKGRVEAVSARKRDSGTGESLSGEGAGIGHGDAVPREGCSGRVGLNRPRRGLRVLCGRECGALAHARWVRSARGWGGAGAGGVEEGFGDGQKWV